MITALNVANNFLDMAFKDNIEISPMKLQKLLYIFYKEYLKKTGQKIFYDVFEVWRYGPVIPTVYDTFKKYGSNSIKQYCLNNDNTYTTVKLVEGSAFYNTLNEVWKLHGKRDGIYLSMLTHQKDTAWSKARERGEYFLNDNEICEEASYE